MVNQKSNDFIKKIKEFANLPKGWHYGDGVAPSTSTIEIASQIGQESQSAGFEYIDAIPGIEGEIQVLCYSESIRAEINIYSDGKIDLILENNGNLISYLENLDLANVISKLKSRGGLWQYLFTFSTHYTIYPGNIGSPALLSNHQMRMAESQLFARSALKEGKNTRYANISNTITQPLQGIQQSFGNSTPQFSPRVAQ